MSWSERLQCAVLLALVGVPLSIPSLQATAPSLHATSFGGWPALGFAAALFLMAGQQRRWYVLGAEFLVISPALSFGYDVSLPLGALGSFSVILPAMLTAYLLTRHDRGGLRLDEVDNSRYHAVTAASALLCGVAAVGVVAVAVNPDDALISGLMSFLAALTAQLVVLPLIIRTSGRPAAAGPGELFVQRVLMAAVTLAVFWPDTHLAVTFAIFPVLGWVAIRGTRRETHVQQFLVCLTAYALTFSGRGPLGGDIPRFPDELGPALIYLFIAAVCYMVVPQTLTVEKLFAMTGHATRSATTLERLLDSASGTVIIATDSVGRITHYNAGAQQLVGYTPEEVMGLNPGMFHTPAEIARHAAHFGVPADHIRVVLAMVEAGERRDWEFTNKDGSRRMTSLTLTAVTEPDGTVVGYIGAGEDITERLRVQDALLAALDREHASVLRLEEVDHVKQELVSNVSHELRTPITSIAGYAELLSDGSLGNLTEGQVDAVARIERNTTRLSLLVADLLTLSKVESGQLEFAHDEIDLRDVVHEGLELLEELVRVRTIHLRIELPADPVVIVGDAQALERVVMNLVSNAIKFTPDGGRVVVTLNQTGDGASLVVSDNGMGIPEEDQQHLFTRFFRSSAATEQAIQGTGLGLSIVHSIVTQHGGAVSIDSAPGRGTTVTVLLPHGAAEPATV
jgi:PAS domain S-box-containing protein